MAEREIRELMLLPYHMASLASSSLLAGYHQDVSISAHIMTMEGTYIMPRVWNKLAKTVYNLRWHNKGYKSYDEWFKAFSDRIHSQGIDLYSGRSLYSTMLPETMNWKLGDREIKSGILTFGTLEQRSLSGSASSIGLVMYRTYGSRECIDWLNASYHMLNEYLIYKGITLSFVDLDLSPEQQQDVNRIISDYRKRRDLHLDTSTIEDPVLRAKKEIEIIQELNNIRESASVAIMKPKHINIALFFKGRVQGVVTLHSKPYSIYPDCKMDTICVSPNSNILRFPKGTVHEGSIHSFVADGIITIDLYTGYILYVPDDDSGIRYRWTMGVYNRVQCTLLNYDTLGDAIIDRTYTIPSQLLMMIESGARGTSTNAIQIIGIVGQQSYENGRIPRMLPTTEIQGFKGPRTLPSVPPGDNSPESRGAILESYSVGLSLESYVNGHIAAREALTSNTELTPETGYFSRRMRTFLENLKIDVVKTDDISYRAVTNERGIIAMWDYIMNPSHTFKLPANKGNVTFIDLQYEVNRVSSRTYTNTAIYVPIPFYPVSDVKNKNGKYLSLDDNLRTIINAYKGVNVILGIDPRIQDTYSDYYSYLKNILPTQVDNKELIVVTAASPTWYLSMTNYTSITVIPINANPIKEPVLQKGVSAAINVYSLSMGRVRYPIKSGDILDMKTIYKIMINGSDFEKYAYTIRPEKSLADLTERYSLFEALVLLGKIQSL